jgi:hypothetical protein
VLVWYRVGETDGIGNGSVLMCGGGLQSGGDGIKWKGLGFNVCWFGRGWARRREMESFQC